MVERDCTFKMTSIFQDIEIVEFDICPANLPITSRESLPSAKTTGNQEIPMHADLSYAAVIAGAIVGALVYTTIAAVPVLRTIILLGATMTIICRRSVPDVVAYTNSILAVFIEEPTFSAGILAGALGALLLKRYGPSTR
jgi:hypothetical protein